MSMMHYFSDLAASKKGPPFTTIAQVLDADVSQSELQNLPQRLLTMADLQEFAVVAEDRERWRDEVVQGITKAYERYLAVELEKHELQKQSQARKRVMKQYAHDGHLIPEYLLEEEWKESDAVLDVAVQEQDELKHGRKRRSFSDRGSYRHNRKMNASDLAEDCVVLGQLWEHRNKKRTNNQDRMEEAVKSYEAIKRAFEEEAIEEGELDGSMDIARVEEKWDTTDRSTGLQDPWEGKAAAMHQASVDANELFEDLFTTGKDAVEDGMVAKKARF